MQTPGAKPSSKTLLLKRGPNGKFVIPISQLQNVAIALPQSLRVAGLSVAIMTDTLGNTTTGVLRSSPDMTPVKDVFSLYKIDEKVTALESDAARRAKTESAQKALYAEAGKEAVNPIPGFERVAVDSAALNNILTENVKTLERAEVKDNRNQLAVEFLLDQAEKVQACLKDQFKAAASGDQKGGQKYKLHYPNHGVVSWCGSKLLTKFPSNVTDWMNFLYPKDFSKGIKMSKNEFESIEKRFRSLFDPSKKIFDVLAFGDEKGNDTDISPDMVIPCVPNRTLVSIGQVRVGPAGYRNESLKQWQLIYLNLLYDSSRVVLPADKDCQRDLVRLLFHIPDFPENGGAVLEQIVAVRGQEFLWDKFLVDASSIGALAKAYNLRNNEIRMLASVKWPLIVSGPMLPEEPSKGKEFKGNLDSKFLRKMVEKGDEGFMHFSKRLAVKGILQPYKKKTKPLESVYFTPAGKTKELLDFLQKPGNPYGAVFDDIEQYLNGFFAEDLREHASALLYASFVRKTKPVVHIAADIDLHVDEEEEAVWQDDEL